MIKKYRKKPVVIEAILFDVKNISIKEIHSFCEKHSLPKFSAMSSGGICGAGVGDKLCRKGDYIIIGNNGKLDVCKPDIFKKTYQLIE